MYVYRKTFSISVGCSYNTSINLLSLGKDDRVYLYVKGIYYLLLLLL